MISNKKRNAALLGLFLAASPLTAVHASSDSVDIHSDITETETSNLESSELHEQINVEDVSTTASGESTASEEPTSSEEPKEDQTVQESYTEMDNLILDLRQTYKDDWSKIDAVLLHEGIQVVDEAVSEPDADAEVLAQGINDDNVRVRMKVYKDMNNPYFHVRGYWDWLDSDYLFHNVYPEDTAGLASNTSIYVRNGSYVRTVYSDNWTTYPSTLSSASGNGKMAFKFEDRNTKNGYVGKHGVFGYSIDNPKKTVAFEAGYIHSWSKGSLDSFSASYPGGVTASYSWSSNSQRISSSSLTIKKDAWNSLTTKGKQVDNQQ